jgi:cytochrome c oxidase assembly protein subunit 11
MTEPVARTNEPAEKRTPPKVVATILAVVGIGMLSMSFAAVPLYRLICQTTGMGGTPMRVSTESATKSARMVTVRFDANTDGRLDWDFRPEKTTMQVKLGDTVLAFYKAKNTSNRSITGRATFNVTPEIAGRFFSKLECFCFTEQTLKPGEAVDMPVTFYVDPALLSEPGAESIQTITLSYTFFEVPPEQQRTAEKRKGNS